MTTSDRKKETQKERERTVMSKREKET